MPSVDARRLVAPQAVAQDGARGSAPSSLKDDDDGREVLAKTLSLEGAIVRAVSMASDALALLPGAEIILTDFALPGEDGVSLLERINKQPRPIPVIVTSGYDESQEPPLATAPFARKLLKPLDFDRVCAEIAAALDGRA
jgi:CheY-like chemotaxis protein